MSCNPRVEYQYFKYENKWRSVRQRIHGTLCSLESLRVNFNVTIYHGKQRKIPFHGISYLLALSLLSVANSALVEFPENAIVLESESPKTIDMACISDSEGNLRWFLQKSTESVKEQLYNGYFLRSDAKSYCTVITDEPGKYNLRLINTAEAAQTYICIEPGTLAEASADLIWLSDLTCKDGSTEDLVNLTCSIEFRGNWAPTMEWKEHSSDGDKVLSLGVSNDTVPNQRVTSTLVMAVEHYSRNYTCTTKFDISGKPSHTTATNVPDCYLTWTTSLLSNKVQEDPSPTVIMIAAIATIIPIAIAAIFVLFIYKKHTKDENKAKKERKERNEEKPRHPPLINFQNEEKVKKGTEVQIYPVYEESDEDPNRPQSQASLVGYD